MKQKHVNKPLVAEEPVECFASHIDCSSDRDLCDQVQQQLERVAVRSGLEQCRLR